jgi:3-deoxy-D-manno-octulosonic-acid transferase
MGRLPASLRDDTRLTVWVHTVSVGEFLAARPLLARLKNDLPDARIVVSTTTLTAQTLARSHSQLFEALFYFPFDWKFSVRRALDTIKPSFVVILETELWPNFLMECRSRGIATILANGRISSRSFNRYRLLGSAFARSIRNMSFMIMQTEDDAERARRLGMPSDRVRVCGNLKYDLPVDGGPNAAGAALDPEFARLVSPHLIVAGSTSAGEEEIVLASFRAVRKNPELKSAQLLLAPRRPERFDEVARQIARAGFAFIRRSQLGATKAAGTEDANRFLDGGEQLAQRSSGVIPDVILLDSIGELASIYRLASVVFVGGSLVPHGGQNIIEPAACAKPIVVGPYTENFRQVVADFSQADALIQIRTAGNEAIHDLTRELTRLLTDVDLSREMAERGLEILRRSRGATACSVELIKKAASVSETIPAGADS